MSLLWREGLIRKGSPSAPAVTKVSPKTACKGRGMTGEDSGGGLIRKGTSSAPAVTKATPLLVFKAHRLVYHSTQGLRVIQKKKRPLLCRAKLEHTRQSRPWLEPFTVRKFLNPCKLFPPRSRLGVCIASEGLQREGLIRKGSSSAPAVTKVSLICRRI